MIDVSKCYPLNYDLLEFNVYNTEPQRKMKSVYETYILREMDKLKTVDKKEREIQSNPVDWNFGSMPAHLLKQT